MISANAVQSAPIGLAAAISTAIVLTTSTIEMTMIHKIFITGMTAVVVGIGIYAVHLQSQIGSLQQEQMSLNQQIAQLSLKRDDAKNQLAMLQQENEQLRGNEMELLRLRGEVTRFRQEQNVLPEALQTTNNTNIAPIEIHTKARMILIPADDLQSLNIGWTSDAQGNRTGLIDEQQFEVIREALQEANDVEEIAEPEVTSINGMETQMRATRTVSINGTNANAGTSLDIIPYFSTNSSTFNLNLAAKLNQLTGDPSQPDLLTIQITNQITLSPGQIVVLETELPSGGWSQNFTNTFAGPRSLLIFVTPQVVDSRGFPSSKYQ
ncbi:MAG: hypothetical protein ABSG87_07155 [Verrucomicrobiota bacterium]